MLYDGGKTKSNYKQAKQNRQAASLLLRLTRQKVIAKTAKAYMGLLLAQKNILVIKKALSSAKANQKMVSSRYKNGFVVKSDLLRANVRIADLKQQYLKAKNNVNTAKSMLNASMGLPYFFWYFS